MGQPVQLSPGAWVRHRQRPRRRRGERPVARGVGAPTPRASVVRRILWTSGQGAGSRHRDWCPVSARPWVVAPAGIDPW